MSVLSVAAASAHAQVPQPQPAGEGDPGASAPAVVQPDRLGDGGVGPGGGGNGDGGGKPGKGDGKPGKGDGGGHGGGKPGKGDGGRGNKGKLKLLRADAKPSTAWFKGRPATFQFAIDGRRKRNVVVQVKRKGNDPAIVRHYVIKKVRPGDTRTIDWDGRVDGGKRYARQGNYKFKVRAKHGAAAVTKGAAGKAKAGFFMHKFPIRGAHTYGDGLGAGRDHRGVDVFARCGTKLQAARAGKVQHEAYQGSGAGHYLVIDGKGIEQGLRLHAPAERLSARRGRQGPHRAERSARSASRATPQAAISTSSSGAPPAGTRAASSSIRFRACAPGTAGASGP